MTNSSFWAFSSVKKDLSFMSSARMSSFSLINELCSRVLTHFKAKSALLVLVIAMVTPFVAS